MISGGVECGPNAVLAFAREGYRKSSLHLGELGATLLYPGFWRLSGRYWQVGMGEIVRSFSKRAFVRALRRLVPEIRGKWMRRARAGVRAQAVTRSGKLAEDFLIESSPQMVHVINAPSPAATSAFNIGQIVADRLFELRTANRSTS
jgi:L-2-hydroxyglutarate oxidase